MSIAWGSLVLLVVLLPGVLFFVGIYWPEQFTRESEPRSPLGQLAGALLVAFVVHGVAYTVLTSLCGSWLPCISIKGLQQDGKFSYIVLSDVTRMYLRLGKAGSSTSVSEVQKMIGASTPGEVVIPSEPSKPKKRIQSLFVIEGEDIANAVFDILETDARALDEKELRELLRQEAAAIGFELSESDLDDIASHA